MSYTRLYAADIKENDVMFKAPDTVSA
jgi:hypothetical protein